MEYYTSQASLYWSEDAREAVCIIDSHSKSSLREECHAMPGWSGEPFHRDKTIGAWPAPSTVFMTADVEKVCSGYLAKSQNCGHICALYGVR